MNKKTLTEADIRSKFFTPAGCSNLQGNVLNDHNTKMSRASKNSQSHDLSEIYNVIAPLRAAQQQALIVYTPLVEEILHSNCQDMHRIEHMLDNLLSICSTPPAVELFRRLCRHLLANQSRSHRLVRACLSRRVGLRTSAIIPFSIDLPRSPRPP